MSESEAGGHKKMPLIVLLTFFLFKNKIQSDSLVNYDKN